MEWVGINGILSHTQFGFKKGRGTIDILAAITRDIYTNFYRDIITNSENKYLLFT